MEEMMPNKEHPMQPLALVGSVLRFRKNQIVDDLLEFAQSKGFGMNEIALRDYSAEDQRQFAQLIGYSLSGYSELSYVDDVSYAAAERVAETGETPEQARVAVLEKALTDLQDALRTPISALFGVHPDTLPGAKF